MNNLSENKFLNFFGWNIGKNPYEISSYVLYNSKEISGNVRSKKGSVRKYCNDCRDNLANTRSSITFIKYSKIITRRSTNELLDKKQ